MTDAEKAAALRAIAEDTDLVRQMFFRLGPDDPTLIPFAQENVRAAAGYVERRDPAPEAPAPERLVARCELWGVPATLVAQAFVTLPGDERVPVELELTHSLLGTQILKLGMQGVREVIEARELSNP